MTSDDPGWGGYVPPEDGGTEGDRPPRPPPDRPGRRPSWQSPRTLAAAAVVAVVLVGASVLLHKSPQPPPTPTPSATDTSTVISTKTATSTPTSTKTSRPEPSSTPTGPVNARFISKADAICTRDAKKIQDDLDAMNAPQLGALPPTTDDTSGLAQDFGALVTDLRDLGNPPQDDGTFALGVDDWQQALDLLSPGNTQDFTINYMAGVNEFRSLGLKVCTGGSAG